MNFPELQNILNWAAQGSSNLTFEWMVHTGIEIKPLALLAPCSDQLSYYGQLLQYKLRR